MATGALSRTLRDDRVRGDVEVLSRAGLEINTFLEEATESVGRAVPWIAACLGTHDPSTHLLTSSRKYGALQTTSAHDQEFARLEYSTAEPSSFLELAVAPVPAAAVGLLTEGEWERSTRTARFFHPLFGFGDEARVVFRDGSSTWGAMALFRGPDEKPFSPEDVTLLAQLSPLLARGVRGGLLARLADTVQGPQLGPLVLVIGADDTVLQMSPGAEQRIADMVGAEPDGSWDPMAAVRAIVGAARRYANGDSPVPPRCRVRGASGTWLLVHAAPLSGAADRVGEVVVTIEEARPPEIVALVVAAFGLTQREREVTQLVLQGFDTKEIAATLHLSSYTVQDHLKAIFEKAAVRSRRELVGRVFLDQYAERMGTTLSPTGVFLEDSFTRP